MSFFSRTLFQNKNIPLPYYIREVFIDFFPDFLKKNTKRKIIASLHHYPSSVISDRLNYYNQISDSTPMSLPLAIQDYKVPKRSRKYYYDSKEWLRFFSSKLRFSLIPGDVTQVPNIPSFVKSRPVFGDNKNSILFKMNKLRHFNFVDDQLSYQDKKDLLVGFGNVFQENRIRFFQQYFHHPLCYLGAIKGKDVESWKRPKLSINEQLKYKFILSLEGNDVATNLKWIMSSNSIAVMPIPKFETWFMEGRLQPGVHFIPIKDDFSDLESQLQYYLEHREAAEKIVANAHAFVKQFQDPKREDLLSYLTMYKYFCQTGQMLNDLSLDF